MTDTSTRQGPASAGPIFDIVAVAVRLATSAVLIALVLLICIDVMLRSLTNVSLGFTEEISGYFVVMLTFFGASLGLRSGALFRVVVVSNLMRPHAQVVLTRLFICVALLCCGVLARVSFNLVLSSFSRGKFSPTVLQTPVWIPQLLLPLGFLVIAFFLIEQFILAGHRAGRGA